MLILVLTLWLQDGIWKTFQSRTEHRLVQIEQTLVDGISTARNTDAELTTALVAFQFNHSFINQRPSGFKLIMEYGKQALRPTVAFPHLILVLVLLLAIFTA